MPQLRGDPVKRVFVVCLFLPLTTTFLLSQSNPVPLTNPSARVAPPGVVSSIGVSQTDPKTQARVLEGYGKLPLSFEANHGQADGQVKFLSRTGGYTLFLTADEAVLALRGSAAKRAAPKGASGFGGAMVSLKRYPDTNPNPDTNPHPATPHSMTGGVLRMKLRNANPAAKVSGLDELAGTSNYFIGNDPAKWRTNVPTYAKVKYEGIYSGIDLVYYGNQRRLEYDFIVAPGGDPRRIAFDIRGAKRIRQDVQGDLVFKMGEDEIRWRKPVAYQGKDGARQLVAARYAIKDTNRVGFELAKYDANRPLYIDPLIYSTYLGGSGNDNGNSIAVDSAGNVYITGSTNSTNFPTVNPLQPTNAGGSNDAFVAKINPSGSALVYSTYLGGSGNDQGTGIAVDGAGNAYVTGYTTSTNFPTMNPFQPANGGSADAFVAELNPTGSALVYSTYLGGGGSDGGFSIAVDSLGNAYVAGSAGAHFPLVGQPFQGVFGGILDAFVAKLNPSGSGMAYSTYLGGSGEDFATGIAVDSAGNAYVTGLTGSPSNSKHFPTKNPLQPYFGGGFYDAFVAKVNPTGSALVYSTFLGGSGNDQGSGIAVDSAGDAYVTGFTGSTNFPAVNPLQAANAGGTYDAFVAKINPSGSALVYSTYLGGSDYDKGLGIAADSAGNAYVIGQTYSTDFPTKNPLQAANGGLFDAFVAKFNPSGSSLVYSTYLGGAGYDYGQSITVDSTGSAYVTGDTNSGDFPTKNPLQPANGGSYDAFVAKIVVEAATTTTTLSSAPNPSIYGQAVTFTAVVTSSQGAPPDGETITFMKGTKVLGTGALSGGSASFTTSTLSAGTDYIKAVYAGDSNFLGSTSKAVKQVVSKATTTTTLASSLNPSNFGQSVTFTASVTPQFSGTVKGSVTFYDGATALKTVSLYGGVAKFTTSTLASGSHNITATYNGSGSFIGSSASLTQTVN
jgi:hypothetical protein